MLTLLGRLALADPEPDETPVVPPSRVDDRFLPQGGASMVSSKPGALEKDPIAHPF
ncbi:MAG: hypothetical protein AAFV53_17675 [Myxococcota bacterium]